MWAERDNLTRRPYLSAAIVGISLLAPFLGGSTEPWAQGVVCILVGLMVLLFPPEKQLQPLFYVLCLLLLVVALGAFLPASWFGIPTWRAALTGDLGITLPRTVSPQPWLSAECWLLLLAGLLWLGFVAAHGLGSQDRWNMARFYVSGVMILTLVAIVFALCGQTLFFWHARQHFGFFPNRNQMGNWLAMGGLLLPALLYEDWGRNRILTFWWLAGLALIGSALVMTYSRAGILIYFSGTTIFLIWVSLVRRRTARLVLGVVVMVSMLTLFLIFGGETLNRFQQVATTDNASQAAMRPAIHRDALAMKSHSPVVGVGLGNFNSVFALFRDQSRNEDRAIHPESDWLWLATEAGWAAVAVVIAGLALLFIDVFPVERGTGRTVRMAAAVAVLGIAVHGWFDVSGHRLGSFIPACFFVMLMLHPRHLVTISPWLRRCFQGAALLTIATGLYWIVAVCSASLMPGAVGVEKAREQSLAAIKAGNTASAIQILNRALVWAPLDWNFYFLRASAEIGRDPGHARMDFLRARSLEPNASRVPLQEGYLWLPIRPGYAVAAWREALARNKHNPTERFGEMLSASTNIPMAREGLKTLSLDSPDLLLIYASGASSAEFGDILTKILDRDPALDTLSLAQKQTFFRIWADKEGLDSVVTAVQQVPAWKDAAWSLMAQDMASRGDFQNAYQLVLSMISEPSFPQINSRDSLNVLQKRSILHPDDFASAYLLIRSHLVSNNYQLALDRARITTQQKNCPSYFYYLRGQAAASLENWQEAWEAIRNFQKTQP